MAEPKHAKSPDDLLTFDEAVSMSGLDFILGIIEGINPAPPISQAMGYRLHAASKGVAVFRGTPTFDFCNPMGTLHGGWYGTLLDSAMACAVQTMLPKGTAYTTLEYKVNIIRPIPLGTEIDAIGEVSHSGRSTGVAEGQIVGVEDGKLYATGSTTCLVLRPKG